MAVKYNYCESNLNLTNYLSTLVPIIVLFLYDYCMRFYIRQMLNMKQKRSTFIS